MKVKVWKYQGVAPRTGKAAKGPFSSTTSRRDHLLNCGHQAAWEDFQNTLE